MKRIDKQRMEEPREEVGGRECEKESHKEAGEEPAKVSSFTTGELIYCLH